MKRSLPVSQVSVIAQISTSSDIIRSHNNDILLFIERAFSNTFNDCNIFEKAEQLSFLVQAEESTNDPRSRFEQFIYFEGVKGRPHKLGDREPSRIPVKQLARAFG